MDTLLLMYFEDRKVNIKGKFHDGDELIGLPPFCEDCMMVYNAETKFVQVSKNQVFQVELWQQPQQSEFPLEENEDFDQTLKEVLNRRIQQYNEEKKKRKPTSNKEHNSQIKTGLTFEALYQFKLKPDLQACLFTRSQNKSDSNSSDKLNHGLQLSACSIFQEKLVVVILKRMNANVNGAADKKLLTEPSTSTYLKEETDIKQSLCSSPSHKRKLQNIIDRSGPKLSKRSTVKMKKGDNMKAKEDHSCEDKLAIICNHTEKSVEHNSPKIEMNSEQVLSPKCRSGDNIFESLSKDICSEKVQNASNESRKRKLSDQSKIVKTAKRKINENNAKTSRNETQETNNNVMADSCLLLSNKHDDSSDDLPDIVSNRNKPEPSNIKTFNHSNKNGLSKTGNCTFKKPLSPTKLSQVRSSYRSSKSTGKSCEELLEEDDLPFIAPPKPRRKSVVKEIRKSLSRNISNSEFVPDEDICTIIEDLSTPVIVKIEPDKIDEIKAAKEVSQLDVEQIVYLVTKNEKYLRDIFQGKMKCRRHETYKSGGKGRRNLTYQVPLTLYSEDQGDHIMEQLLHMFCKKHMKYMDYVFRVLFPEILIKIFMDVHETSHEEAEQRMAEALLVASQNNDDNI